MTIDEFQQAASAYNRRMKIGLAVTVGIVFVLMVIVAGIGKYAGEDLRALFIANFGAATAEIVLGLSPFPIVLVLFGGIWWIERHALQDPRLHCRHCHRQFASLRYIVTASQHCPHCGRRVLEELPENVIADLEQRR